jgi:hypothetical protein
LEHPIDGYFRFAIGALAVLLLLIGGYIALTDKTRAAVTPLAFGLLFIAMVFLAKFRHFEFWGMKFETWDQKQVEAAELVDRLRLISDGTSEQVALIAAKIGTWDSGFTNPQLQTQIDRVHSLLTAANVAKARQEEILEPVYNRVHLNLFFAACQVILKGFEKNRVDFLERLNHTTDPPGQRAIQAEINANDANLRKFRDLQGEINQKGRNAAGRIGRLLNFAREVALTNDASIERDLQDIKLDDEFFLDNKRLRREIDFTYLYQ